MTFGRCRPSLSEHGSSYDFWPFSMRASSPMQISANASIGRWILCSAENHGERKKCRFLDSLRSALVARNDLMFLKCRFLDSPAARTRWD